MTQVIDQSDDGEFVVQSEEVRAKWYQQYLQTTGGWPPDEEDPTLEQVSTLDKRINTQDISPFVDFGVWVPFGSKAMRASRLRAYVLTSNGYATKELPGPATFVQWRASYRILRTALMVMLDAVSLASLHAYEMTIERLMHTDLSNGMACDLLGGRVGKVITFKSAKIKAGDGCQRREAGADGLGCKPTFSTWRRRTTVFGSSNQPWHGLQREAMGNQGLQGNNWRLDSCWVEFNQ